jgi:SAM-dependent methyltransferase
MAEWFERWFDEDYALLYAHRDEVEARQAVHTALAVAPELTEGPVLDLACGAGRHLTVLQERNPTAFGLDLSEAMLRLAPDPLQGHLVRGDMRALPFREGAFCGICMWFTPFGYFDDQKNAALLARLKTLLRPGGVLLIDYFNAGRLAQDLVPEDVQEQNGIRILSQRRMEGGRVIKDLTLHRLDTGEERHAVESVRVYAPEELEAMAHRTGLRVRQVLGNYDGAPFGAGSPRWIGILQRDH